MEVAHLARGGARAHFSVRDAISERPVATLSLIWIDDYWHIDQLKGLRNAEVAIHQAIYFDGEETVIDIEMTELYFAAQELFQRYRSPGPWSTIDISPSRTSPSRSTREKQDDHSQSQQPDHDAR